MVGDRESGAADVAPGHKKLGKITSTKMGSIYPTVTGGIRENNRKMPKPLIDKARKPHEWVESDIEDLQIEWKKGVSDVVSVPLKKVLVCPKVFQVRDLHTKSKAGITSIGHVTKLAERLDKEAELDPILVLPISANRFVVVDGTHRRAAYDRRNRATVPVRIFTGTLAEARIAAGRSENSKRKLEWTHQEKSQYLYQLILNRPQHSSGEQWTQKECAEAADRTERLARMMERFIRQCKDGNKPVPEKWNGGAWASDEVETESAEERLARQYAQKLRDALGPLTSQGKARALGLALSQYTERADDVALALVQECELAGAIIEDLDEMVAERVETQVESVHAQTAERQYLSGLFAAVGAGF